MKNTVELGDKVKDLITGLTGVATARISYLTGCDQVGVTGCAGKDGKYPETHYLDIHRLVVVKKQAVKLHSHTDGAMTPPSENY